MDGAGRQGVCASAGWVMHGRGHDLSPQYVLSPHILHEFLLMLPRPACVWNAGYPGAAWARSDKYTMLDYATWSARFLFLYWWCTSLLYLESHRHHHRTTPRATSRQRLILRFRCRLQNVMNNSHTNGQYGYHSIQSSGHAPSGGGSGGMLSSLNSSGGMHNSQPSNSNANAAVMIQQLQMMEVRVLVRTFHIFAQLHRRSVRVPVVATGHPRSFRKPRLTTPWRRTQLQNHDLTLWHTGLILASVTSLLTVLPLLQQREFL